VRASPRTRSSDTNDAVVARRFAAPSRPTVRREAGFRSSRPLVVASRPVRRILYRALRLGDGHPSRPAIARRLLRPTRGSGGRATHPLCSALLRVGFVEPLESPPALVRSYRTVSPLPVRPSTPGGREPPSAVCSLWHFPAGHPDWALPSTLPCGVRTFLGRVTSRARTRPSGRLATTAIVAGLDRPCRRTPSTHRPARPIVG
jgi:hypothetical protein